MRILAIFAAATVTLSLAAGCKVGPQYSPPEAILGGAWSQPLEAGLLPDACAEQQWWLQFQDPALHYLVENARRQNLTLRESAARVDQARALRGIALGGLFPNVNATASYTRNDVSDRGSPFGLRGFGFPPFDFWSTGFDSSWEIDLFGKVRRTAEAADADIGVAVEEYHNLSVTLVSEVAANYITFRTLQERIVVGEENVRIQEETLRITERRFQAGAVSDLDVSQAQSNLHRTRSAIPSLRASLKQAQNRLCILQGQPPRDLLPELGNQLPIPQPPPYVAVGLPVNLLRQRPDIRGAERRLAAQSARIGVAAADLYPRLSLNGTFTVDSTRIEGLFNGESIAYRVGPALSWNILNFGRIRSNVAAQQALWQAAIAGYQQQVLTAAADVEDALALFHYTRESEAALGEAVAAASRASRTAEIQYREGATSFQSLLDAQRFQAEIQDAYVTRRGDVSLALVSLYKALGGGWACTPAVPLLAASSEEPVPPPVPVAPYATTPLQGAW